MTMMHCVEGRLSPSDVEFDDSLSAVGVVLASDGYPGQFEKGHVITGWLQRNFLAVSNVAPSTSHVRSGSSAEV